MTNVNNIVYEMETILLIDIHICVWIINAIVYRCKFA